jgi:hypothetical protein
MIDDTYIRLAKQMSEMVELNKRMASMTTAMTRQIVEQMDSIDFSSLIPVVDFKLPVVDTSSLIRALDLSIDVVKLVQPAIERQDILTQQIQEMTRAVDSVTQQVVADLVASVISFQEIISSGIFDDLIALIQAHKDADEAFKTSGWPIVPSMPFELRERVVSMHKQGKTRYVSKTIMGYYQRNNHRYLIETVETWKNHPLFASRMHIIKDALQAHCDGRYTLSVPALIPQIEGILSEYVLANNLVAKFGKIQQVYYAVIGDVDDYGLSTWAIASTLLYQLQNSTYVFTDFENELKKSVNARKTTRHTVLHGITTKYNRPIHSLKAFLLLDAISALQELGK